MAAAALVDLKGGTAEACAEAFAMALTNLEGLVCDPVAGLVELPCIKRNVIGAVNAVSAPIWRWPVWSGISRPTR